MLHIKNNLKVAGYGLATLLIASSVSSRSIAESAGASMTAQAIVPITLSSTQTLSFGVVVSGASTDTIDTVYEIAATASGTPSVTSAAETSSGVFLSSGTTAVGTVAYTGESGQSVTASLSKSACALTGVTFASITGLIGSQALSTTAATFNLPAASGTIYIGGTISVVKSTAIASTTCAYTVSLAYA